MEFNMKDVIKELNLKVGFQRYEPNNQVNVILNGNKFKHRDCSTRAICKATGKIYDEIFDMQLKLAKKYKTVSNSDEITRLILGKYGFKYSELQNTNILSFILLNPIGTFVVGLSSHIFCIIDGIMYDNYTEQEVKNKNPLSTFKLSRQVTYYYTKI